MRDSFLLRIVFSSLFPDVEDEVVSFGGHALEGNVTGGEEIAAALGTVLQAVFGAGDDFFFGTCLKGCTVHVTAKGNLITVEAFDLTDINACHRVD